jgi:hypothetical protein
LGGASLDFYSQILMRGKLCTTAMAFDVEENGVIISMPFYAGNGS